MSRAKYCSKYILKQVRHKFKDHRFLLKTNVAQIHQDMMMPFPE